MGYHRAMRAFVLAFLLVLSSFASGCEKDDEDHIDDFVSAVTGTVDESRIEHVLRTYVDLAAEPIDVRALGESRIYRAEDRERFDREVRRRVGRLDGRSLNAVRKRIDLSGNEARIELQLLGRSAAGTVRYTLHKRNGRWLIGSVAVSR